MKLKALCLAALCAAGAATADETRADIAGSWTFRASVAGACSFGGQAYLTPTEDADRYGCELTARQACPDFEYVVRQSCVARRTGDQLAINSTIEEFLKGEPTPFYFPDNFALSIKSSDRMAGALLWAGNSEPAEFIRDDGSIS